MTIGAVCLGLAVLAVTYNQWAPRTAREGPAGAAAPGVESSAGPASASPAASADPPPPTSPPPSSGPPEELGAAARESAEPGPGARELSPGLPRRRSGSTPQPARGGEARPIRGVVYDLATLRPVAGAQVVFRDLVSAEMSEYYSLSDGRYRIDAPKRSGAGFAVQARQEGYLPRCHVDGYARMRSMPRADRLSLGRRLSQELTDSETVAAGRAGRPGLDIFLIPKSLGQ